MTILGSPEEVAIPVGYVTFEMPTIPTPIFRPPAVRVEEKLPPVAVEAVDWRKYIPWALLGIALLAK